MIEIRTGYRTPQNLNDIDDQSHVPTRLSHGDLDSTPKTSQAAEDMNKLKLRFGRCFVCQGLIYNL